jgi:hypothetical protein
MWILPCMMMLKSLGASVMIKNVLRFRLLKKQLIKKLGAI